MSATDVPFERLEALLRGDEPRTLEEKERASLISELRAGALAAPETLRASILATAPAMRHRRVRVPSRRLVLVVAPVAVALAVGAALIHGFVGGGSNRATFAAPHLFPERRLGPVASPVHAQARKRVTAGGSALRGPGDTLSSAQVDSATTPFSGVAVASGGVPSSLTGKLDGAVTIPKNRLVHADASMEVQVRSHAALQSATNKASQIVSALGGYAQSVQYQASRQGYGNAFLQLRVPVGKANTAIGQLGALGSLVSQEIQTQDLQHQLSQQTSQIGSLRRAIAIYQQALNSGSVTGSQRVEVQIRLSNAEHSLKVLGKARSRTVASGATADIALTLTTNKHAIVGGRHHHNGVFGRRLGDAAHFLGLEAVYALYVLVLLSPFILLGLLGWALVRERRRREERRLLASA